MNRAKWLATVLVLLLLLLAAFWAANQSGPGEASAIARGVQTIARLVSLFR